MISGISNGSTTSRMGDVEEKLGFKFKVVNIENLEPPKNVVVKLDFNGTHLGSSTPVPVGALETKVEWEIFYEVPELTQSVIADFASHPFVFSVLYEDLSVLPIPELKKDQKGKKNTEKSKTKSGCKGDSKTASITNESKRSGKSGDSKSNGSARKISAKPVDSFIMLGMTNLDIVPLLMGKGEMSEMLLINPVIEQSGSNAITWTNLPRLQVSVTGQKDISNLISKNLANLLHITLESLHNITPEFNENTQVATIIPCTQEFVAVKFTNGSLINDNMRWSSRRKKWFGLSGMQGQAALSSYKVNDNIRDLTNSMDFEISNETLMSVPRIQWYQLHRSPLNAESQKLFKDKLIRRRCWPLEVLTSGKRHSITKTKSEKKSPNETGDKAGVSSSKKTDHFLTFMDLSRLLYPGVTSVRVVSQLFTFEAGVIERRFGSEHNMFEVPRRSSLISKVTKAQTPKSVASKKEPSSDATSKSAKKGKGTKPEPEAIEEEPVPAPEPEPVFNEEGHPIFVIVQVDLLKPLVEKKTCEEVVEGIRAIIPSRQKPTKEEQASINAEEAYDYCIKSLMNVIHSEYQLFYNRFGDEKSCKNFLMHLHMKGAYAKMKESIKESVEVYIKDTIGIPDRLCLMKYDHQNKLAHIYTRLVSKMCSVVNSLSNYSMDEYEPCVSSQNLLFYAIEAMEEDAFDKAKEYLLQRLDKGGNANPEYWLDYAKHWVKRQEYEKAEECAKEAISLDARHIPSLFFLGLLSWLMEDLEVAEMFLTAVVAFDCHCLEGWVALHILHKQMNKTVEASAELLNGKKCIRETLVIPHANAAMLMSWCNGFTEYHRIFLLTAIHMIYLSFPELAEVALSYDMLLYGRTGCFLYYLAVCHYHQGRYVDSLIHLEEALTLYWENDHLRSLKGHNLYKLKKNGEAKEAYQLAVNFAGMNDDFHLTNLRLGKILTSEGDHCSAQKCYLTICRQSPTPLSWLGLGITAFMDDEMDEAEMALNEANMLDCRLSQVWGYLALVNLMMSRPAIYNKCMGQALRYGLDDPVILERLHILSEFVEENHV